MPILKLIHTSKKGPRGPFEYKDDTLQVQEFIWYRYDGLISWQSYIYNKNLYIWKDDLYIEVVHRILLTGFVLGLLDNLFDIGQTTHYSDITWA